MGDVVDRRPGGGGASAEKVRYKDEGDGSHSESVSSNLRVWNSNTLAWDKVASDGNGNLNVNVAAGAASGTEYTEGDTDATIAGTAVMWEDTSDTLRSVSAAKPFPVNIVAGSGSGTEYTEGATDATITGAAILWEDAADTLRPVSASTPLPINIVAGSSAGTEYTEDAASAANPAGGQVMARRRDSLSSETTTDGDVTAVNSTAKGELYVKHVDAIPVTDNAGSLTVDGTVAVSGTVTVDLGVNNDVTVTSGSVTADTELPAAAALTDNTATPTAPAVGGFNMVYDGAQWDFQRGTAADGALVNLGTNNDVTVTGSVTADTELPAAAALADNTATPTAPAVGGFNMVYDGANWDFQRGTSADGALVNLGTNNDVTVTGTVDLGATDNAVLDNIDADLTTIIGHVDGLEGLIGTTNTNTAATTTAVQLIDDAIVADDATFTAGTTKVMMAGLVADETGTDSVGEDEAGAARMTLDRRSITVPQGHSTGGLSVFRSLDLDETEEDVKTSPGTLYGWYIANLATSTRYVKFYNATAASVTVGGTTPYLTFPIPGNTTDDIAANLMGGVGIKFDTAISVACTTGLADADTGAPGTNDLVCNLFYA